MTENGATRFRTRQSWAAPNTDGFVLAPVRNGSAWDIQILDTLSGSPEISRLAAWGAYSADGTQLSQTLEEGRRTRLELACYGQVPALDPWGLRGLLMESFAADDHVIRGHGWMMRTEKRESKPQLGAAHLA